MEVSIQFHAPVALYPRKEHQLSRKVGRQRKYGLDAVRDNSLKPTGNQTLFLRSSGP